MSLVFHIKNTNKSCKHWYKTKYRHELNECFDYCTKCGLTNNSRKINETLTPYIIPASKQSSFEHIITPLHNVRFYVEKQKFSTNWDIVEHNGFRFPAIAEPHCDCGMWKTKGCLEHELHNKLGYGDKIWLVQYQRSCYRPICQICYLKWIARQANRATRRIEKYQKKTKWQPIHIFLSAPLRDFDLSHKELRKKVYQILKEMKFIGGAVIFHPFRLDKATKTRWNYSPHFHIVGYGYIAGWHDEIKRKYGWELGYRGKRESVFQTFCYLLSHCGVKKGFHTVTWFGDLSYGKLKILKEVKLHDQCPYCLKKLVEIYHEDVDPGVPPWQYYEGPFDPEGWHPVHTMPELKSELSYDYAPTRDLNETLKGLAEAN